jgi:nitrogen-specific signal transduction histidine kinase
MAHGRHEAFDLEDYRMIQLLAEFAAMGVRHQQQQKRLIEQAASAAAAAMANELAHKINNPLQSLTNILYLASNGLGEQDLQTVGELGLTDLDRLSKLVAQLLNLPFRKLGK